MVEKRNQQAQDARRNEWEIRVALILCLKIEHVGIRDGIQVFFLLENLREDPTAVVRSCAKPIPSFLLLHSFFPSFLRWWTLDSRLELKGPWFLDLHSSLHWSHHDHRNETKIGAQPPVNRLCETPGGWLACPVSVLILR